MAVTGKKHMCSEMTPLAPFSFCLSWLVPSPFSPLVFIAVVLHVRSTLREFPRQLVPLPLFPGRREAQRILVYETVEQGIQ